MLANTSLGFGLMWNLSGADAERVCRDLAYAELANTPMMRNRLGDRLSGNLDWGKQGLDADSLTRMNMATAAATWANAHDSGHADLFLARKSSSAWAQALVQARSQGAANITFATSGSLGQRKHIRHQEVHLWQEVLGWTSLLQDRKRVIVCCPVHHIYGFIWGVMLPVALNLPVFEMAWDGDFEALEGDLVVGVPTQWHWWSCSKRQWPRDVIGVSSTGPLAAQSVLAAQAGGLAKLLAIYGSTETAGLGWRDELLGLEQPQPYKLGPARQRLGAGIAMVLPDGSLTPLDVQDQLAWRDNQHFDLAGRLDDVVQVAGHNVSAQAVRRKLLELKGVKNAAVRLDALQGRLKFFVVLHEDESQNDFERRADQVLRIHERPVHLQYGRALPQDEWGKLCDWVIE